MMTDRHRGSDHNTRYVCERGVQEGIEAPGSCQQRTFTKWENNTAFQYIYAREGSA